MYSSSRLAASSVRLRAQLRFAISLRRPPERTHLHIPGCLLSGTTSPKRRGPANSRQPLPCGFHTRSALECLRACFVGLVWLLLTSFCPRTLQVFETPA